MGEREQAMTLEKLGASATDGFTVADAAAFTYLQPVATMPPLSRDSADGAHSYTVPSEHTRQARVMHGPSPHLYVDPAAVLGTDPDHVCVQAPGISGGNR
jgi:hypothetical protein